jgi:hypothetical protein
MNDAELKILINVLSNTVGGQEAKRIIDEINEKTKEAGKDVEKHGQSFIHAESSGRAFHRLLHEISHESPIMGEALRLALNPVTGMIMGGVLALHYFKQKQEEARKAAEQAANTYASSSQAALQMWEAQHQSMIEFEKEVRAIDASQSSLEAKTNRTIQAIERQKKLLDEINQLSGADEAKKKKGELWEQEAKIKALEKQAWDARQTLGRQLGVAAEAERGAKVVGTPEYQAAIVTQKAQAESLQKQLAQAQNVSWLDIFRRAWEEGKSAMVVAEEFRKERETLRQQLADTQKRVLDLEAGKTRAEKDLADANKKALETKAFISKTEDVELPKMREDLAAAQLRARMEVVPGMPDVIKGFEGAEETAKALHDHKQVTETARKQMMAFAEALAGHAVSLKDATDMMLWAAKNQGNFITDIERLAKIVTAQIPAIDSFHTRLTEAEKALQKLQAKVLSAANP